MSAHSWWEKKEALDGPGGRQVRLFERTHHLEQMSSAAANAAEAHGSIIAIYGEAGIGKSTLVDAFIAEVGPKVLVLRGACDDLLAPPAFGPIREALGDLYVSPSKQSADGSPGGTLAVLMDSAQRPDLTILVVEDVHWADDSTLDALQYLTRRISGSQILLVVTYRADEVGIRHPLRALLGAMAAAPLLRIELRPLSPKSVEALAAGSPWNANDLFHLTGGNPFFLTEALSSPHAVPSSVVDMVLAKMRGLDQEAFHLLEQLAVIPSSVNRQLITEVAGEQEQALIEFERLGLLIERHGELMFRHEIGRRAIEQSLPAIRRRSLNQNIVRLLLKDENPELPRLLHHAVQAGDIDTLLRFAPSAAAEANDAGAHRQAVISLEAVIPHIGRLDPSEQAALHDDYAWELYLAGRYLEAIDAGRKAMLLGEKSKDPSGNPRTLLRQARRHYGLDELATTEELLERARQVSESIGSSSMVAEAEALRGAVLVTRGELDAAMSVLDSADRLARAAGRADLTSVCLCFRGIAGAVRGDVNGLADIRASITVAIDQGEYETAARAYANLAETSYRIHQWSDLPQHLAQGAEFATRYGFWNNADTIDLYRALLDLRRGRWDAAEERLRALVATDEQSQYANYSRTAIARLSARRGDPDAGSVLGTIWQQAVTSGSGVAVADAGTAYVEWAWLNNSPDIAALIRDTVIELPAANAPIFSEFRRYMNRAGAPLPEPMWEVADNGFSLGDSGNASAAAAYWAQLADPYERALELARTEYLQTALQQLKALGASATVERLGVPEPGVGKAPSTGRLSNPTSLTDRQQDVLFALAQGATNTEIASSLGISVRTVEHHVAAILGKLHVRDRRSAVEAAQQLGIQRIRP